MRVTDGRELDAFPTTCEVRGCDAAPEEWHELGRRSFEVCHVHGLQLRAGEACTISGDELLVGEDSAPELVDALRSTTPSGIVLTLGLGHHGIVENEVSLVISKRQRDALRTLLQEPDEPGDCP